MKRIVDCNNYSLFAVHDKRTCDWIMENGHFNERFSCCQAHYGKKLIDIEDIGGYKILPLTMEYKNIVSESYDAMDDSGYIERLINMHHLWGIFEGGSLAGYIGEHLEGSMGLLEIFPEYREKGYGTVLEKFLINKFLQAGRVPFCQVVDGNYKSIGLQKKLGMIIGEKPTYWLF